MSFHNLNCPQCKSNKISKNGKIHNGKQNYKCRVTINLDKSGQPKAKAGGFQKDSIKIKLFLRPPAGDNLNAKSILSEKAAQIYLDFF